MLKIILSKIIVIAFAATMVSILPGCSSVDNNVQVGTVVSKRIVGVAEDGEHDILAHRADDIIVYEDKYRDYLHDTGGEGYIDQPMAAALNKDFPDVRYIVDVSLCDDGGNQSYYASRVIFNQLKPGMVVKFELDKDVRKTIIKLME
jgi:hypothetical protein